MSGCGVKAVIFDLGGVLAHETDQVASGAAAFGLDEETLREAYWGHRPDYDWGRSSDVVYWSALAGRTLTEDEALERAVDDSRRWVQIRPTARAILADLKTAGVARFVLSNAPAPMQLAIDESDWRELVDGRFVSGQLKMAKPDAGIYRHVEETLGLSGPELAFIDDRPDNLDVPTELGWQTRLWRDDTDTRDWLVELGLLGG